MFRIRYYSETLEPRQFGRLIRFLNWFRYWLETLIQYLVLKHLLKTTKVAKELRKPFVEQFKNDVKVELQEWKKDTTHEAVVTKALVAAHHKVDAERPVPVDEFFSRYLNKPKERRYALSSRDSVKDSDISEPFEPIEAPNGSAAAGTEDGDGEPEVESAAKRPGRTYRFRA